MKILSMLFLSLTIYFGCVTPKTPDVPVPVPTPDVTPVPPAPTPDVPPVPTPVPPAPTPVPPAPTPEPESPYMTEAEIIKAFNSYSTAAFIQEAAPMPDKMQTTTDIDKFLGKLKKGIDDKRKVKSSKGVQGDEPVTVKSPVLKVDLRSRDTPVISQWNGTCTAHGLGASLENLSGINLSEKHIWNRYQVYSCESAIDAWKAKKACITTSAKWPNANKNPYVGYLDKANCNVYLDKTTYIENDLQAMVDSLAKGRPVYIGMTVTSAMSNCSAVLNPKSKATSGGHALSVVGYTLNSSVPGGGYFTIKNSWGSDCGDKGYQYLPMSYCTRSDMYCVMWTLDSIEADGKIK